MTQNGPAKHDTADLWDRLNSDPAYCGGRIRVKGTRYTVALILGLIASGYEAADILKEYPGLEDADIRQCARWGAWETSYQRVDINIE